MRWLSGAGRLDIMAPYVFRPNDPFPFPERHILMAKPVASTAIARGVFKRDEMVWIDGWVADLMRQPDTWVRTWTQLLALRAASLRAKATKVGNRRGYNYSSKFLAWFSVQHTVVALTLQPGNRPTLAAELKKCPYEVEVLKGNHYTGSALNGVLAEGGGLLTASAALVEPLVRCGYCGVSYKQTEPWCRNCGGH
jgi:hypothetical protein